MDDDNLWAWELFQRWKDDLEKVTEPLHIYQGKYAQYKDFLSMQIQPYLDKIEQDESKEIKEIKDEIEQNKKREKEVKAEII